MVVAHVESYTTVGRVIKNTPKGVRVHFLKSWETWNNQTQSYDKGVRQDQMFKLMNKVVKVDPPQCIVDWLHDKPDVPNKAILEHWLNTGELLI